VLLGELPGRLVGAESRVGRRSAHHCHHRGDLAAMVCAPRFTTCWRSGPSLTRNGVPWALPHSIVRSRSATPRRPTKVLCSRSNASQAGRSAASVAKLAPGGDPGAMPFQRCNHSQSAPYRWPNIRVSVRRCLQPARAGATGAADASRLDRWSHRGLAYEPHRCFCTLLVTLCLLVFATSASAESMSFLCAPGTEDPRGPKGE
jgi:hypothetical protein